MKLAIGIDPGVNTGFSVKDLESGKFISVESLPIHVAMAKAMALDEMGDTLYFVVEDARKRKWFGNSGNEVKQGAGSVKRDSKIWDDFLNDLGHPYRMEPPRKGGTKYTAQYFERLTGWNKRTNEHARDAAMLVAGLTKINLKVYFNGRPEKKLNKSDAVGDKTKAARKEGNGCEVLQ